MLEVVVQPLVSNYAHTAYTNDENIKQKNDTIKAKQKTEHVRNHKIFLIYDLKDILSVCLITSN